MYDYLTNRARHTIDLARYEAAELHCQQVETEHLLLALLGESRTIGESFAQRVLTELDISEDRVRRRCRRGSWETEGHLPFSLAANRILQAAAQDMFEMDLVCITTGHLVLALADDSGMAGTILRDHGADKGSIRSTLAEWAAEEVEWNGNAQVFMEAPRPGDPTLLERSSAAGKAKVFLSYRRVDSAGFTGWLYSRFSQEFGPDCLFKDLENISYGQSFVETIQTAISQSAVMLAIIGPRWNEAAADGRPRMFAAGDYIRLELETAFDLGTTVIPVLIDDTPMPQASELPQSLAKLPAINAAPLRSTAWSYDVKRLIDRVREILDAAEYDPSDNDGANS